MKSIFFILIFAVVLITACSESSSPSVKKNEIFPLKAGNSWTYQSKSIDTTIITNLWVEKDTLIQGESWYKILADSMFSYYYKNLDDGLWALDMQDFIYYKPSNLIYKYPAKVNDEYYIEHEKYKIISIDQKVEVPAGTFSCYVYQNDYSNFDGHHYFNEVYLSQGTGIIKSITYDNKENNENDTINNIELTSYTLK